MQEERDMNTVLVRDVRLELASPGSGFLLFLACHATSKSCTLSESPLHPLEMDLFRITSKKVLTLVCVVDKQNQKVATMYISWSFE